MNAARELVALLADGVQATDTGITVVDATDPDCPLLFVNTAFQTLTDYPGDQLLGRNSRFLHGPATSTDAAVRTAPRPPRRSWPSSAARSPNRCTCRAPRTGSGSARA
jgi:hypothetical protein